MGRSFIGIVADDELYEWLLKEKDVEIDDLKKQLGEKKKLNAEPWQLLPCSPYLCQKFRKSMFRQCTAFFLLLAFLASTFSKAVIVVDFYANQDYIVKNLCVNKDKPMTRCCGRCQLRKRLTQEDEQDKSNPERQAENRNEVLFLNSSSEKLTVPLLSCSTLSYPVYIAGGTIDRPGDIFHPPA